MPREVEKEWVYYVNDWQLSADSNPEPIVQIRNNPIIQAGPGSLWTFVVEHGIPDLLKLCLRWEDLKHSIYDQKAYYACDDDVLMFTGETRIYQQGRCHQFMFVRRQENTDEISFGWAEEEYCCKFLVPLEE